MAETDVSVVPSACELRSKDGGGRTSPSFSAHGSILAGPGVGIRKWLEGRQRGSDHPSLEILPRGKTTTFDASRLCEVSDVISDLSNNTVITHAPPAHLIYPDTS